MLKRGADKDTLDNECICFVSKMSYFMGGWDASIFHVNCTPEHILHWSVYAYIGGHNKALNTYTVVATSWKLLLQTFMNFITNNV